MNSATAQERIVDHVNAMKDVIWNLRHGPEDDEEMSAPDPWPVGETYGGWRLDRERGVLEYLAAGMVEFMVHVEDIAEPELRLKTFGDVEAWFRGEPQVLSDFVRATSELFEFRARLLPVKAPTGTFAIQIEAEEEPRTWRLLIGEGTDFAQVQRSFAKMLKWTPEDVTRWLEPEWVE